MLVSWRLAPSSAQPHDNTTNTACCTSAQYFAPRRVYKSQRQDTYDASNLPNTPFPAITAMVNSSYQSKWRTNDSPDKCWLETAIRPCMTKFSRDPSIPPLPPVDFQVPENPPPHFPAFPTDNLDPSYKSRPEHAFQIVWDTNYRRDAPSYKLRPEDAFQIVWDSNYRNDPALAAEPEDPLQGDITSRNSAQSSTMGEVGRTCRRSRSPACRHNHDLGAARKQRSESEPVYDTVQATRDPYVLEVEDDDGTVSSYGQKTFTPGRICGDLTEASPGERDSESRFPIPSADLQTTNVRPRGSFFEIVLNPKEE